MGADANARCRYDMTPLSVAVQFASLDIIELLFEHGASTEHGAPLHLAARFQRPDDIIIYLIGKGASVNALLFQDDDVSFCHYHEFCPLGTPLHEAAQKKDKRIFSLLLQHGADRNIEDNFGNIPTIGEINKL